MYHITKLKPIRLKQSIQLQNDTKMKEHIILPNEIINYIMEFVPKDKNYKSPIVDILSITARRSYDDSDGIQRDYTINVFEEKRRHILKTIHYKDVFINGKNNNYNNVLGV
jgi:hypothetical protein